MPVARKNQPHHLPHGMGRTKAVWPPVPRVPDYRVRAVEEWIKEHRDTTRPLTCAAPLLAIVCELRVQGHPWPTRRQLAEALYGRDPEVEAGRKPGNRTRGTDSIDSALNTALAEGEVSEVWDNEPGDTANRASIRRIRYIIPSDELFEVYQEAVQRRAQPLQLVS
jgi:hypothetical protein